MVTVTVNGKGSYMKRTFYDKSVTSEVAKKNIQDYITMEGLDFPYCQFNGAEIFAEHNII